MLSARGVKKAFGATQALAGVDLDARAGEITAVIGQNGAGKSTLMSVLAGALVPDAGTMTLDGATYAPRSPRDARASGVAMVHQELSLCAHLSVTENILLGALPAKRGLVDWKRAHELAREAIAPLADTIDPREKVGALSIANQQLVETARALGGAKCRVLILDEPTSSLGAKDTERLFARLRELRSRGIVILYLSHFLEEVKTLADRFVVVRDGRIAGEGAAASTSIDAMVGMMAGRQVEALYTRSERDAKEVALSVEGLGDKLEVRRGEVVGLAGLVGAGRTELLRSIVGLDAPRGRAKIRGRVAMVSEDRKGEGLATALSVADNVTLGSKRGFVVTHRGDERATAPWIERLGIRAKASQRVAELSGGNQQKVAIARVLHDGADVLLVDEPTRGIDVEAKAQIYALVDQAARDGKAVLLVSSYVPELLGVCDRVHVMRRGAIGPSHDARATGEHEIIREAAQ